MRKVIILVPMRSRTKVYSFRFFGMFLSVIVVFTHSIRVGNCGQLIGWFMGSMDACTVHDLRRIISSLL